ncbi:MAG: hypothetical protein AAGC55_19295, partial [Myxococcota bacterium]
EALVVPIVITHPAPEPEPQTFEDIKDKRVLLAFYDTSEPTIMLDDGPAMGWRTDTGPETWMTQSSLVFDGSYGPIQPSPKAPSKNKELRGAKDAMLAMAAKLIKLSAEAHGATG